MIKMKAPVGVSSLSVDGAEYLVSNGRVDVKPEHVAGAEQHGFVSIADDDPNSAPTDDIDTMSRNELFAFLKASKVAVTLPVTNDVLRSIAKDVANGGTGVLVSNRQKAVDEAAASLAAAVADVEAAQKAFDAATGENKDRAQVVLDAAVAAKTRADEALAAAQA